MENIDTYITGNIDIINSKMGYDMLIKYFPELFNKIETNTSKEIYEWIFVPYINVINQYLKTYWVKKLKNLDLNIIDIVVYDIYFNKSFKCFVIYYKITHKDNFYDLCHNRFDFEKYKNTEKLQKSLYKAIGYDNILDKYIRNKYFNFHVKISLDYIQFLSYLIADDIKQHEFNETFDKFLKEKINDNKN